MTRKRKFSVAKTIALGFAVIIFAGALVLMLPISNRNGLSIPFIDALLTSTSATCVTGLVVYDTWTQFSGFGQIVILLLIQIGGLGFMTFAVLFSMLLGKRIGLKERSLIMEAVSSMKIGGVVRLVRHIAVGTLLCEGIGAIILSVRFCPVFGPAKGIWYGVFHSISAFCNAGFDLMGYISPRSSLTLFASDAVVNLTVCALIVSGGVGFIIWEDIITYRLHFKKYSLHSKIVLAATCVLILVPTVLFFITERGAAFAGMSAPDRVLAAIFQSVTTRTAGFNTVDMNALSPAGSLLTIFLMVIGGAPGSTAGGLKITTFAVVALAVVAHIRNEADVNIFHRRIGKDAINKAFCAAAFYSFAVFCGIFWLTARQNFTLPQAAFEAVSALSTVGLSTGITPLLFSSSKIGITLLMFAGRVGSLTVLTAVAERPHVRRLRNPDEKIIVG